MRKAELLYRRNKDIEKYFNERYKAHTVGSSSAKFNIAMAETAEKFYLAERTVCSILKEARESYPPLCASVAGT